MVRADLRSAVSLALGLAALVVVRATPARADGSFPDAQQILLPADRPEQIILGTNFGMIVSEDGGRTWLYSCEHGLSAYAGSYRLAPLPWHRIFSITAGAGLIYSDDDACSWQSARGAVASVQPYGFSVDPSDGRHVFVFGAPRLDLRAGDSIYVSDDGGVTFGDPVFTALPGSALLGVLSAPSQPDTVFGAMYSPDKHPILLGSHDAGQHWETVADLVDAFGDNPFELLSIDSADAGRIYARILGPSAETLAISSDGGKTFVQSVAIPGKLKGFLKLASGTILVGGTAGILPVGYRSTDDGQTFQPWPQAPRVHALAERHGKLYVAANNYDDGYAIAESEDEGLTLRPLMAFGQVTAMKRCTAAVCEETCAYYAGIELWPQTVCRWDAGPPEPERDGAADGEDAGVRDATPETRDGQTAGASGGCGCGVAGSGPHWTSLLLVSLAGIVGRERRRRSARQ